MCVPVEADDGDDITRADAALQEAGCQTAHAIDKLSTVEAEVAGDGDSSAGPAGEDATEALGDVATCHE